MDDSRDLTANKIAVEAFFHGMRRKSRKMSESEQAALDQMIRVTVLRTRARQCGVCVQWMLNRGIDLDRIEALLDDYEPWV